MSVDEAKRFLEHVQHLTEIEPVPNVFKRVTLDRGGTRLVFSAASGNYTMIVRGASGKVHVTLLQNGMTYRQWGILPDEAWEETQAGDAGPNFTNDWAGVAQKLIHTVGSRPTDNQNSGSEVGRHAEPGCTPTGR